MAIFDLGVISYGPEGNGSRILNTIKTSQLDFYIQETPYSAFITIRKKYIKGFKHATEVLSENIEMENVIKDLKKHENEKLKTFAKEKEVESESNKNNVRTLEERLEKAEKEMLKHFEHANKQKSELSDEINILKSLKKKDNDVIANLKIDLSKSRTESKSLQKELSNMQNKNENLKNKVEYANASKREIINKNEKLASEVKTMKKKIKHFEQENNNEKRANNNDSNQNIKQTVSVEQCAAFSTHEPGAPSACTPPGVPSRTSFPLGISRQLVSSGSPPATTSCAQPPPDAPSGPSVKAKYPEPASSPSTTQPASTTRNHLPAPPPPLSSACSPHTPPGTPPCRRPAESIPPPAPAYASTMPITEDYMVGINKIDLGPRVNDLSKM